MRKQLRIAISCPDHPGLLAAVAGQLFDVGGNLGDATFAVLGQAAELTVVCTVPSNVDDTTLESSLAKLPAVGNGNVVVEPFALRATRAEMGTVTHAIHVRGQNQPGLVARLTESFNEFGANVVRMTAEQIAQGTDYRIDFELWVDEARSASLLDTAANIAESLGLSFEAGRVEGE